MKMENKKFGDWITINELGKGGNGTVWLAKNLQGDSAAVKVLGNFSGNDGVRRYERFKNEIKILRENSDIDGLLPIIESCTPDDIAKSPSWYAMPVAQPLDEVAQLWQEGNERFERSIEIILDVGKTLIKLHEREISHRDIKPANILIMEGKTYLSDFGLVSFREKPDLTKTQERIGAKWTLAPEMERDSKNADGRAADVYSVAKTLWMLITRNKLGFEGQYDADSVNGLSQQNIKGVESPWRDNVFKFEYLKPMDDLLKESTDHDPHKRPTMAVFVQRLETFVETTKNWKVKNPQQWRDIHLRLFPVAVPQRAIWTDIDSIIDVLNIVGSANSLNHMHLPDGGGMDLCGAVRGSEQNTIELNIDPSSSSAYLVKPKRLLFEGFGVDTSWSYFRLEADELESTGIGFVYNDKEILYEIATGHYISLDDWDQDRDGDRKYPLNAKRLSRYLKGDFLIIQKSGTYNRNPYTYDGRHNRMTTDEFRKHIEDLVEYAKHL